MSLDLGADVVSLTESVVNIESVSQNEKALADEVEQALGAVAHLEVTRVGHSIVARTDLGRAERVVIAGHLDTVPLNHNLPARNDGTRLHGLGSCDMKGGVAVALRLAHDLATPNRDVTYVFYEAEEIDDVYNGLGIVARQRPDLVQADFAILMEPSDAVVEAGCQGTLRVEVTARGSAPTRPARGAGSTPSTALRRSSGRLNEYDARKPVIDGLEYHEGLNAVLIRGGVATNVLPDECVVTVNFRFAPDRSEAEALVFVKDFFEGYEVVVTDSAPGALPGLGVPAAKAFVAAVGGVVNPKFGWTDVARFTGLGIPAVNYGPGDPMLAHKQEEFVPLEQLRSCETTLRRWLGADS